MIHRKTLLFPFAFFLFLWTFAGFGAQTNTSILANGKWIKVQTENKGIVKITYEELEEWGITSFQNVAVFGNGGYMAPKINNNLYPDDLAQLPIIHAKDNNNKDAIFFHATGSVKWSYDEDRKLFLHEQNSYTNRTYFFITDDKLPSPEPELLSIDITALDTLYDSSDQTALYEKELLNPTRSGTVWYSERIFSGSAKNLDLSLSGLVPGTEASLTVSGAAQSVYKNRFLVSVNQTPLGMLNLPRGKDEKDMHPLGDDFIFSPTNDLSIRLFHEVDGVSGDAYLDYVLVNYKAALRFSGGQLQFRNASQKNYNYVQYKISGDGSELNLWDVSDYHKPRAVGFEKSGSTISFSDKGETIKEYVLFDTRSGEIGGVHFVEHVANQNIHGLPLYEMIIVTHPDFIEPSETLAEFHRQHDNLSVLVLTTKAVYNEFSGGAPDAAGIRNMLKMFYDRGKSTGDGPRYALLMGDGTYNNREQDANNAVFIPTYQSEPLVSDRSYKLNGESFVTDDFFVLLDQNEGEMNGKIDVGIGRIPCRTLGEAELMVEKTMNYVLPEAMGDWRNVITFLADDEDGNTWMAQSEALGKLVNNQFSGFNIKKIYFDAYTQVKTSGGDYYPGANEAINRAIESGTLLMNYIGHANEVSMADEDVLSVSDIRKWNNGNKQPVFVTATCEFSRFDADQRSAGEEILFNPAGGAVALFSTTRLVYSNDNFNLSKNFYNYVFQSDEQGNNIRLGDIIRLAKNATNTTAYNSRSFTLLGDPALRLAFPKYKVQTSSINGVAIKEDTAIVSIGALDKVTVHGQVSDNFGNLLSDFEGSVSASVYDKETLIETLNNDNKGAYTYPERNNVIYKGVSTVKNGKFSFSFIVPKDITYNLGTGKIYYYATSDSIDGNGSVEEFHIGGSSNNPVVDFDPPEMEVYLNDESFQSYDVVSSSALLVVDFYDESGINTVGTGIGHDITGTLNDDVANQFVLNDFYNAEPNTYQRGKVIYPLNNLEPGEYKLTVKAWDVQNNSISKDIFFVVEDGFKIISVKNFPNPVSFYTEFNIMHNLPGDVFETKVELYNARGAKIHEINEVVGSNRTTEAVLRWDITETKYPLGADKMLIYRVTMRTDEGLQATGAGKLLLNKY